MFARRVLPRMAMTALVPTGHLGTRHVASLSSGFRAGTLLRMSAVRMSANAVEQPASEQPALSQSMQVPVPAKTIVPSKTKAETSQRSKTSQGTKTSQRTVSDRSKKSAGRSQLVTETRRVLDAALGEEVRRWHSVYWASNELTRSDAVKMIVSAFESASVKFGVSEAELLAALTRIQEDANKTIRSASGILQLVRRAARKGSARARESARKEARERRGAEVTSSDGVTSETKELGDVNSQELDSKKEGADAKSSPADVDIATGQPTLLGQPILPEGPILPEKPILPEQRALTEQLIQGQREASKVQIVKGERSA